MAIKMDTIEALREKMKKAPEVAKEKRTLSKQDAIRELKKDIEAMQKRGYTLEDIAKFLTDGGLQITQPTLRSYIQRTKASKPKATKQEAVKAPDTKPEKATPAIAEKAKEQAKKPGSFDVRKDEEV